MGSRTRLDAPQAHRRGLPGRPQEIAGHLPAAHRHLDQAAHLGRGRQVRGQAIGQGVGQGQGHRHFP